MTKQKIDSFIVLSNGGKLHLLPISEVELQDIIENTKKEFGDKLNVPTYKTEIGEDFEWDADSLEKDGTEKDKEKWDKYQEHKKVFTELQEERSMFYVLTEGVKAYETAKGKMVDLVIDEVDFELELPEGWIKKRERQGYKLSDDIIQNKFDFVNSLLRTIAEKRNVITRCVSLGLKGIVKEGDLIKYEATFQRAMEQVSDQISANIDTIIEKSTRVSSGE